MKPLYQYFLVFLLLSLAACSSNQQKVVVPEGYSPILITINYDAEAEAAALRSVGRNYRPTSAYGGTLGARRQIASIAEDYNLLEQQGWMIGSLSVYCALIGVPNQLVEEDLISQLRADPRIESAQYVRKYAVQNIGSYNDPYFNIQFTDDTEVSALHSESTGNGVKIAVIDTGADISHPELNAQMLQIKNFVDSDNKSFLTDIHGTAVTGIIAAQPNNALGIVGLSPDADIWVLKACWQLDEADSGARCNSFTIASAISHAIDNDVDIINMSLAGPEDPLVTRLVEQALQRGIIVVAADPVVGTDRYPAMLPGVISVRRRATEAQVSAEDLAIYTESEDILTTVPDGGFAFFSGTSMSAAIVTALSALMVEQHPEMPAEEIVREIEKIQVIGDNQRSAARL